MDRSDDGGRQSVLCEPSQRGWPLVALQPQKNLRPVASAVHFTGVKLVPLWEPSQKGWRLDWPQEHHQ